MMHRQSGVFWGTSIVIKKVPYFMCLGGTDWWTYREKYPQSTTAPTVSTLPFGSWPSPFVTVQRNCSISFSQNTKTCYPTPLCQACCCFVLHCFSAHMIGHCFWACGGGNGWWTCLPTARSTTWRGTLKGQGSSETLNPGQKSHTELFVFCLPGAE